MWSLPFRFPEQKFCMHFYSLPYVPHAPPISSCSAYPNIIWWKSQTWSSSFCIYLQSPAIYSLSGPTIFHITVAHLQAYVVPQLDNSNFTSIQNMQNYRSVYFNNNVPGQQPGGQEKWMSRDCTQTNVPQSASTSCRTQQCCIEWRLLFLLTKDQSK